MAGGPPPTTSSPERPGNPQNRDPKTGAPTLGNPDSVYDVPKAPYFGNVVGDWGDAENPKFLERSVHHGNYGYGAHELHRGRMTQLVKYPGNPNGRYQLNFLWNPGAISTVFGFDESQSRAIWTNPDNRGIPDLMTGMNLSFQLMFVRQREVAMDPENMGVLVDTGHIERMLSSNANDPNSSVGQLVQQPMSVTFGWTPGGKLWEWSGVVTGCSVQYLMFSSNMIPTIAQVDITFSRRFWNSTVDSGGSHGNAFSLPAGSTVSRSLPPAR